jgi:hypothetical protein
VSAPEPAHCIGGAIRSRRSCLAFVPLKKRMNILAGPNEQTSPHRLVRLSR